MGKRLSTGVSGPDSILSCGVFSEYASLVPGGPGTGKTTLCLPFLTAVPREKALFITLDKNLQTIRWMATMPGRSSDRLALDDVSPADIEEETNRSFDMVASSEPGLRGGAPLSGVRGIVTGQAELLDQRTNSSQ